MKIVCYGVRENERPYFERLNKYHFDLKLEAEFLTADNANRAQGMDAVLIRGNCDASAHNLTIFAKDYGIKYVFTRSVGYNHIDLDAAAKLGIQVARVPNYSPYAVAELAMTLGMQLFRHTNLATTRAAAGDFRVTPDLFSREIHSGTVGIIGAGKIGTAEARLYAGMGARVLASDGHPTAAAGKYVDFVALDTVLQESNIVSLHIPYFPGNNDHFVDADFLAQMKPGAILVNTARGEIVDTAAVIAAVKAGQLGGYAGDVLIDEQEIMGHRFGSPAAVPNPLVRELEELYPRVILTPHIGSYTVPALTDMIAISFENFYQSLTTGTNPNVLVPAAS